MTKSRARNSLVIITIVIIAGIGFTELGNGILYPQDSIRAQLDRFVEVFNYVNRYYVEQVENEKLMTGAIQGMLSELDPHSVYIPKKDLQQVTEQFQGQYEGIGIEFMVHNKILTVVSPIVGGPSEAVGLQPGDQIIRIEGESAYGITEDEVMKKLRGPKGSKVELTIRRPGQQDTFTVIIVRNQIPIYSLTASFMLDDKKTGYVYLGRFARTTSDELEKALKDLEAQGMKQLIFDLRLNSGGYLEQAVEVADKFIPGGYKIVYTRGRLKSAEEDFYSTSAATHRLYPVILLIDHGSASASEIVAGAIQDLDRGLVVGERSFGKGLVQNQIPLKDGSALRLTVARYFTPSGRLIQRPYDGGLMDYYTEAGEDAPESNKPDTTKKTFLTVAGRKVYGGGGITPDSTIASDRITRFTNDLIAKRVFFEFGSKYATVHREWGKDFQKFKSRFFIDDKMLADFKNLVQEQKIEFSQEAFDKDQKFIKMLLKAEAARHLWDSKHYYMIRVADDSQVQAAVTLMPEAAQVLSLHEWNSGYSQIKR
jgi:carboxyl-terminal processing protease